jgi:hypothetical protein
MRRYDWPRVHKVEDNLMMDINELVYAHVLEHFGVDEIEDLSEEQIAEIEVFRLQLGEYSVLQGGYSSLISMWESQ